MDVQNLSKSLPIVLFAFFTKIHNWSSNQSKNTIPKLPTVQYQQKYGMYHNTNDEKKTFTKDQNNEQVQEPLLEDYEKYNEDNNQAQDTVVDLSEKDNEQDNNQEQLDNIVDLSKKDNEQDNNQEQVNTVVHIHEEDNEQKRHNNQEHHHYDDLIKIKNNLDDYLKKNAELIDLYLEDITRILNNDSNKKSMVENDYDSDLASSMPNQIKSKFIKNLQNLVDLNLIKRSDMMDRILKCDLIQLDKKKKKKSSIYGRKQEKNNLVIYDRNNNDNCFVVSDIQKNSGACHRGIENCIYILSNTKFLVTICVCIIITSIIMSKIIIK